MPATLKLQSRDHYNGRACAICHAPNGGAGGLSLGHSWYDLFWAKISQTYARKPWMYSGKPGEVLKLIATFCADCHAHACATLPGAQVDEVARVLLTMFRLKQQTLRDASREGNPK